jgi:O-6-methylguanine DNA methyltransferase
MQCDTVQTAVGTIEIYLVNDKITKCVFVDAKPSSIKIDEYYRKQLKMVGTDFQLLVWNELLKIPSGETRTYSDIAVAIGRPKACRAVAKACGQNKIAIFIPCHRVVAKNGLGGYEWGVDIKQQILYREKHLLRL